MNDQHSLNPILYLIEPEETWDQTMIVYEERRGLELLKFVIWYVIAVAAAAGLCLLFRT